ncbi:helix-turn-helix transcriptional regulator [Aestuariicoccus sp. MJ-SS9]|uniref:helix-turn-helix domain-containing protein n=1 Tax=Aestuariicoccus sp. MJ-SS9 TaxID=3079855 RepID=UPI00290B99BD|nr:helix-turn-helix transcriptional regulator [Aestuariicoccus sp. MJ-SS9]MDU8911283.1 helix-turn-helix transcriptional regulator [Aestuariicoccus sp. MJ-SS9]
MTDASPPAPSPADLRSMLGANLRKLARNATSISALCRDLKINRTQFNRYLAGESFPRPDVLYRICTFFDVDARILLQPVDDIQPSFRDILNHPVVAEFIGAGVIPLNEETFPSGFYRFSRPSFVDNALCLQNLVYVFRRDGFAFLRGFEARQAMLQQGLRDDPANREFRGVLLPQEGGVAAFVSRRNSLTTTFNFLSPLPSISNAFWVGYAARTTRETVTGKRVARLVYEYLGRDTAKVLGAARRTGLCPAEDLPTFHRQQLRLDQPFT